MRDSVADPDDSYVFSQRYRSGFYYHCDFVVTFYFIFENYVNVKRNKQKNLVTYPDPDSLVRSTDPRIRIRTKMSRIRNTAARFGNHFISISQRYKNIT
jgi:hypothetical protein